MMQKKDLTIVRLEISVNYFNRCLVMQIVHTYKQPSRLRCYCKHPYYQPRVCLSVCLRKKSVTGILSWWRHLVTD